MTRIHPPFALQAGCVAIGERAILIDGPPGTGKSSLALGLIDRGAYLIGDDSVMLATAENYLIATPHPRTRGLLEVRNLGLLPFPCREEAPVALVVTMDAAAPRYIERPEMVTIGGIMLPRVRIWPEDGSAIKAELALRHYGLHF
ncbi:HPr kinase/phosphatase C-terminal domain-containing protein [Novosphingobium sp.]|uniref:HPr kinase/phosphorylase n=1 Tax=Novosphingobium sp. TaxID=1874826 RepID=UPI002B488284|nr:HPr kinase/phosphatase C-terminal domain-containing protein [Novosphingobium sp.]HKR90874.1 HPr kinase/phosphatase C-terminal domain-containing protein [Novosphingobium sp.]